MGYEWQPGRGITHKVKQYLIYSEYRGDLGTLIKTTELRQLVVCAIRFSIWTAIH